MDKDVKQGRWTRTVDKDDGKGPWTRTLGKDDGTVHCTVSCIVLCRIVGGESLSGGSYDNINGARSVAQKLFLRVITRLSLS